MVARFVGSHRRYNPLLDEWVLCSPHRLERPWLGKTEDEAAESLPAYDPTCALCPGNRRSGGAVNPPYGRTFVFDNDFPALAPANTAPDAPRSTEADDRLLVAESETGVCRVVCFSPRHDLSLARMDRQTIGCVIETWIEESLDLGRRDGIAYVQVFENKGELMGCSNPHPHGQIWAASHVPTIPARKAATQEAYFRAQGTDLLGDYLDRENRAGDRLVVANHAYVALVPFWAVWPYETMVIPRRHVGSLSDLDRDEQAALADVIKRLATRYDNLFRCSFPYSMGWHARPNQGEHRGWRLHAVFYPPLLRSSRIRKFLVGYEMTAEPQRDLTAEDAAARLRDLPEIHYLEA